MLVDNKHGQVLLSVIVPEHKASAILQHLKTLGVSGGSIIQGCGTADSKILKFLELGEVKKEKLMILADKRLEETMHQELASKFKLTNPAKGIAFSVNATRLPKKEGEIMTEERRSNYTALYVIVERGRGDGVIEIASAKGAKGGTVFHGRGSGIHEKGHLFGFVIEPEKEIVLMLIEDDILDEVAQELDEKLELEKPGAGIMFSLPVNMATGLVE